MLDVRGLLLIVLLEGTRVDNVLDRLVVTGRESRVIFFFEYRLEESSIKRESVNSGVVLLSKDNQSPPDLFSCSSLVTLLRPTELLSRRFHVLSPRRYCVELLGGRMSSFVAINVST